MGDSFEIGQATVTDRDVHPDLVTLSTQAQSFIAHDNGGDLHAGPANLDPLRLALRPRDVNIVFRPARSSC